MRGAFPVLLAAVEALLQPQFNIAGVQATTHPVAPLRPVSEALTARTKGGRPAVVDGPYLETKDVIGGYFVVEADSAAEAGELAKACPAAEYGGVEVRAIIPMG